MAFTPSAEIPHEVMKDICELTLSLTMLRQKECSHLCIENYAPEVFTKLIAGYLDPYGNYRR